MVLQGFACFLRSKQQFLPRTLGPCLCSQHASHGPALLTHATVQPPLRLPGGPSLWSTSGMSPTSYTFQEAMIPLPLCSKPTSDYLKSGVQLIPRPRPCIPASRHPHVPQIRQAQGMP